MGMPTAFANDLLKLLFNGTAIANVADNAATAPLTNLYLALHTADPGAGGNQSTSEVAYTGYARVAVARTSVGFTVTTNSVALAAAAVFPTPPSSGVTAQTAGWFSIGTAASGTGLVLYSGAVSPTIGIGNGTAAPELTTGTTITES